MYSQLDSISAGRSSIRNLRTRHAALTGTLNINLTQIVETSGTTQPTTLRRLPADMNCFTLRADQPSFHYKLQQKSLFADRLQGCQTGGALVNSHGLSHLFFLYRMQPIWCSRIFQLKMFLFFGLTVQQSLWPSRVTCNNTPEKR
jgi:hypothetical protein